MEDRLDVLSLVEATNDGSGGTGAGSSSPSRTTPTTTTTTVTAAAAAATQAAEDHQVGIIASGFAWVDRQRERRRREYLQHEAEKQIQKIAEAEFARKALEQQQQQLQQQHHNRTDSHQHHHHRVQSDRHRGPHEEHLHDKNVSEFREPCLRRDGSDDNSIPGQQQHHHHPSPEENVRIGKTDISKSGEGASAQLEDLLDVLGGNDYVDSNNNACDDYDDDRQDGSYYEDDDDEYYIPEVRVDTVTGDSNNPFILSPGQMHEIACRVLPKTIAFCRWRRLYGLNRDGDSFDACIRIIGSAPRTLMVIRTTKGAVFGGFTDTPWMSHDHNNARFYGSAAACLFSFSSTPSSTSSSSISLPDDEFTSNDNNNDSSTLRPRSSSVLSSSSSPLPPPQEHTSPSSLQVYRWTGRNRYIQLCDVTHKMLAFGGGGEEGAFGLCVQEDFTRGSTGPCDTFGNAPLCDPGSFDIVDVEFWEFLTGVF